VSRCGVEIYNTEMTQKYIYKLRVTIVIDVT